MFQSSSRQQSVPFLPHCAHFPAFCKCFHRGRALLGELHIPCLVGADPTPLELFLLSIPLPFTRFHPVNVLLTSAAPVTE